MKLKTAFLLCVFLSAIGIQSSLAQNFSVSGKVTSKSNNEPIQGATVAIKGKDGGATTSDAQGGFTITVPNKGTVLTISHVDMKSVDHIVNDNSLMIITLESSAISLEEVVINVGYGTQKKSVVTGAISSVKARDLEKVPNGRIEQALQGRVSGVTIAANAGQPGASSTIRVRGLTSFGSSNEPLYVIDGIVVDAGAIGFLNQSDIESIEVLKDATSASIYGTRAANGVILITSKKGKAGKITVNYNGFYATSAPAKRLELLNATEYGALMNEKSVAGGGPVIFSDLSTLGKGTDWQNEIFSNSARRFNHEFSLSGGGDRSTFYISMGMQDQQGIVSKDISNYNKKNIRINSNHKISKVFTFNQTLGYTHQKSIGIGNTNSEYGGPLSSAINLDPTTPVVVTDPALINSGIYANPGIVRDQNGNPYGISSLVGQEMTNPKAYQYTRLGGFNWSDDIVGNAYLEASFASHFKFKTTAGGKLAYWGGQGFTPIFYLSPTVNNVAKNSFGKSINNTFNWTLENTLQYSNKFGNHDVNVLLGQGAYVEDNGGGESVNLYDLPITSYQDASFNFDVPQSNRTSGSYTFSNHKLSSLFARLNYNYKEKYLVTGVIRRDGSSRFGANNKYAYFPGGSVGWVLNKENFWPSNNYVKTLKLRTGYGVTGNDGIGNFGYLSRVLGGYNYTLGNSGGIITGYAPLTLDNPDLRWEQTSQFNIGFDAQIFRNFNLTVEWYKKKTKDILRPVPIPGYVGAGAFPDGNVADMQNTGFELEFGYRRSFGKVNFSANGNFATLKNEVTKVDADKDFIDGVGFQSMGTITRIQVGESYNSFYGYQTNGIFQNQAEIDAYNKNGTRIQPGALPGDFRWVDTNGDGTITSADKTFLGNSLPKYTFGLTLNADYKGFDVMVFAQGAAGNKIFQGLRRLDIGNANYQTEALDRWTGEGTSNKYPRLSSNDPNGNFSNMSDFYLEKGDYLRLKIVQLGYTITAKPLSKIGVTRLRVYVTGENLATLTKYTGYDPEIGGGVFGVDRGYYPQARSFLAGIQLGF